MDVALNSDKTRPYMPRSEDLMLVRSISRHNPFFINITR
jgi:hypothetical protein